ncbi:MAG: hypothetical protein ACQGVC_05580 [Myxococcota bacterium]
MDPVLLGWLSLAVVLASGALWFRRALAVRLPADRRGFVAVWLVGIALGVAALGQGAGWLAGVPAALAVLGGVFFCFTVAISRQRAADDAIAVGATLPAFRAPDDTGAVFDSAVLAGRPVLIKFFRGHW